MQIIGEEWSLIGHSETYCKLMYWEMGKLSLNLGSINGVQGKVSALKLYLSSSLKPLILHFHN